MYGDISIHDKSGILGNQLFFLVIGRKIAKRLVNDLLYFIGLKMEVRSILDMHGSTDVDAKGWVTLGSDVRQSKSRKSRFPRSCGRDTKKKNPRSRRPQKGSRERSGFKIIARLKTKTHYLVYRKEDSFFSLAFLPPI